MIHFYFCWAKEHEDYDPMHHNTMDLDIFKVSIQQEEGGFAEAQVILKSPLNLREALLEQFKARKAFISMTVKGTTSLLFCGRFIPLPLKTSGNLQEFKLTSRPLDAEQKMENLHRRLSADRTLYNPYFSSVEQESDSLLSLEGGTQLHYWCPKTHCLSLSDIFEGRHHYTLRDSIFKNSLSYKLSHSPLSRIQVTLKARWLQESEGRIPLTAKLRHLGQEGLITTLTPYALKKRWWKEGQKLSKANYWVDESSLEDVSDTAISPYLRHQLMTSPIMLSSVDPLNKKGCKTPIRLKARAFKPKLVLGWKARHIRDETLKFELSQNLQNVNMPSAQSRELTFHLHALSRDDLAKPWRPHHTYSPGNRVVFNGFLYKCNFPHRSGLVFDHYQELFDQMGVAPKVPFRSLSSFFNTQEGYDAFDHALRRAGSYLLASSRALEISFRVPIDQAPHITCDTTVSIKDSGIKDGQAVGKVKRFRLVIDHDIHSSYLDVVLGVSIAPKSLEGDQLQDELNKDRYVLGSYCHDGDTDEAYSSNHRTTAFGLTHELWNHQGVRHHFGDDPIQDSCGLLDSVTIQNQAFEQETQIHQRLQSGRSSLLNILKNCQTNVSLRLRTIKPYTHIKREIVVLPLKPLNAPYHISL